MDIIVNKVENEGFKNFLNIKNAYGLRMLFYKFIHR